MAIALLVLKGGALQLPDRNSRAAFSLALAKIREGWSKEQVRQVVGPPDDEWPPCDPIPFVQYGDEVWAYGTNGHHSMPTLGFVRFGDDGVVEMVAGQSWRGGGAPPPKSVIGEAELRQALRTMYRSPATEPEDKPQRLVQVANLLIGLGRVKALAVLREYDRIALDSYKDWLFWVVGVAFVPRASGGVFSGPSMGAIGPELPKDDHAWTTFPVVLVDGVPINFYHGGITFRHPASFNFYLHDIERNWEIRRQPIVPPNDPFRCYQEIISSPGWKAEGGQWSSEAEAKVRSDILSMVGTAYRPTEVPFWSIRDSEFDRYHREYLEVGGHWDRSRHMYVRRDGAVLAAKPLAGPEFGFRFENISQLDASVRFSRGESGWIQYIVDVHETGASPVSSAVLVAEDPLSGHEFNLMQITGVRAPTPITDKAKALRARPHAPASDIASIAGWSFELRKGQPVRFTILRAGERYVTPVYTP